jgi:hypothetical protein
MFLALLGMFGVGFIFLTLLGIFEAGYLRLFLNPQTKI